jgi:MFS family permease
MSHLLTSNLKRIFSVSSFLPSTDGVHCSAGEHVTSTTEPVSGATSGRPQHLTYVVFIAAAAAMGGFLFGYDSSVINGAVVAVRKRYDVASAVLAEVIAAALIGSAVGAAIAGRLADRFGRIRVMQAASVLFTASAVGSALPFALWDLAMWRVLGGIAIGMASVVAPAYIAEVSPPAYRGRLASFQQAAIVVARTRGGVPRSGILGQS